MKKLFLVFMFLLVGGCASSTNKFTDIDTYKMASSDVGEVEITHDEYVFDAGVHALFRKGVGEELLKRSFFGDFYHQFRLKPGVYTFLIECVGNGWTARPKIDLLVNPGSKISLVCTMNDKRSGVFIKVIGS